jgi:AraC-like DNA-binding protein
MMAKVRRRSISCLLIGATVLHPPSPRAPPGGTVYYEAGALGESSLEHRGAAAPQVSGHRAAARLPSLRSATMARDMDLPAATARALLAGFGALGLDVQAIGREAGIDPAAIEPFDAVIPGDRFEQLWRAALRRAPREEFPTEVGLAIPFGAFGALDYLAGSSRDVAAGFEALAAHFRQVAAGVILEVERTEEGGGVIRLLGPPFPGRELGDEFTIAVFVGRFRAGAVGPFRAERIRLTRPAPPSITRHERLLVAPVTFGCAVSALELPAPSWSLGLRRADPALQATLRQLAARLELGAPASDLEAAVRARLRSFLPGGAPGAAAVARALGVSERTLQRRLQECGTSFRAVLERFREAEAERLLDQGTPLAELALRLGFSDQTAWNRAFRRWKGTSPTEWRASRRSASPRPPPSGA